MALPPAFLDELRARTPLSALVSRRVKLSKSGRNWKGCCPFHNEKSPSFYVYDDGFHCFGCGAHGDAISFLMQTAGASFPEAVEQLAGEAGLEVPKASPRAVEAERQRLDLHEVLEAAQASFVRRLHEGEGAAGLAYLRGRGLTDATIERFGLGWSGDGRGALTAELGRAEIGPDRLLEAGLLRANEDGGPARELYWGRVTFPIRDRRGRLISFGGRTLGDAKPKYINGPDTTLFSKRRNLYALNMARDGVRGGADLIVAEGYMDVIALHQGGFTGAVAPLGTAFTMEQDFYKGRLSQQFGLDVLVPDADDRAVVHRVVYDELVQGRVLPASRDAYRAVIARLVGRGAEAVILGCTEIMLLVRPEDSAVPLFDTTRLHAEAAVRRAVDAIPPPSAPAPSPVSGPAPPQQGSVPP